MNGHLCKKTIKTEYKNVYQSEITTNGVSIGIKFRGLIMIKGQVYTSIWYDTKREAALWVDKKLINHKLPPRNILKKA